MGILKTSEITSVENDEFSIIVSEDSVKMYNKEYVNSGLEMFSDNPNYFELHATELKNIQFNSMLMLGLGLGLTAYFYQNICHKIWIVEDNPNIIDIIKKANYLKNEIIISHGNALDFNISEQEKFDLIFVDIFGMIDDKYQQNKQTIIANYTKNLTENGVIYFPDTNEIISAINI
jgi:spermidine synthase